MVSPISTKAIAKAIEIIGTEGITDDEVESQVAGLVSDPMEARRLIDWIPEIFGMVLVGHLGEIVFSRTFSAKNAQGQWCEFPLVCEPIFALVLKSAQEMCHNGPPPCFRRIAYRSAVVASITELLSRGRSIDGSVNSGPFLLGIPAELYPEQRTPFLNRLFAQLGRMYARWTRK